MVATVVLPLAVGPAIPITIMNVVKIADYFVAA